LEQGSYGSHKVIGKDIHVKECGHSRILLGGNVEFLGEAWKNQRLGLALSEKTYIQNLILKFEGLFGKEFKPIKIPMSEGYHTEIDDSSPYTGYDSAKYRSINNWLLVAVSG
jgi:hypothetical protein